MKIVYLKSTSEDLHWVKTYYSKVFPQGCVLAQKQFKAAEQLLLAQPDAGHKTHREGVREFSIPKTPFSVIYRIQGHQIEVLRFWDERREREY